MVFGYGHGYHYAQGASIMPSHSMAERATEYDRALQQSMSAARRRQTGASTAGLAHQLPSSSVQTIPSDDRDDDGGVGSELGDSYVDGDHKRRVDGTAEQTALREQEREELEELADGGMVGLLTQIYGRQRVL